MVQTLLTILSLLWWARTGLSRHELPRPRVEPSLALPAEIRSALLANAEAMQPQVSAEWVRSRSSTITIEAFNKTYESQQSPHTSSMATELLLRGTDSIDLQWQADRKYREAWRSEAVHPDTHALTTRWNRVYAFDGETFFDHGLNPGEPRSLSMLSKADIETKGDLYYSWRVQLGYFYACGLKLPVRHQEIAKNDGPTSTLLNLLEAGATLRAIDLISDNGVALTRLTLQTARRISGQGLCDLLVLDTVGSRPATVRTVFFDLDPARNDALRHIEFRDSADKLLLTDDCTDFQSNPAHAAWLPQRCTIRQYADGIAAAETTTTFDLKRLSADPIDPASFTLEDRQPGTWIIDHDDTDRKTINVVQQDGSLKLWKRN